MRITKFGHSCLLVEEGAATATAGQARIMIDPGKWSSGHTDVTNLDAIFITHKHQDHADPESVRQLIEKSGRVVVYSNLEVCEALKQAGIQTHSVRGGETIGVKGVSVQVFDVPHEDIYYTVPRVQNVGYLIAGSLFHPGDSMGQLADAKVEILALPACAPWLKGVAQGIEFGKSVRPKVAFPIHDAMLGIPEVFYKHFENNLEPEGLEWRVLEHGKAYDFN